MAGMFCSLKEAAEKLGKTEQQVQEIVKNGQLREFRDGATLLFKTDEVESLLKQLKTTQKPQHEDFDIELAPDEELTLSEPTLEDKGGAGDGFDILSESEDYFGMADEKSDEQSTKFDEKTASFDEKSESFDDKSVSFDEEELAEGTAAGSKFGEKKPASEDISVSSDEKDAFSMEEEALADDTISAGETDFPELSLDSDQAGGLMDEGTKAAKSPAASDFLTDDVLGGAEGTGAEASLDKIEEDVNLDSFGSGSGLLDLNLQADDTSLGGVLEEIYSSEGNKEDIGEMGGGPAADVMGIGEEAGAEQLGEAEQAAIAPVGVLAGVFEPEPTATTNTMGVMMFLPLLAAIYTAIIVISGFTGVIPAIFEPIQGMIWYVMAGLAVAAGVVLIAAFAMSPAGEKKPKKPKEVKVKASKPPKPAKPVKTKEAKPKVEKKGKK